MGSCSTKKQKQSSDIPQNQQEQCSIQDGSFSRQPQLKSSVQTPNFHQNTGSIHQASSKILQQFSEKKIKSEFQNEYKIIRQHSDCLIVQQIESGFQCKAYIYSKTSQDSEQFINRLFSMPLNHEQIIKLVDIYNDVQNYIVVYESLETITLKQFIKEKDKNQEKAGLIFNQMTNIIAYIHEQQYSHGSLTFDSFEIQILFNSFKVILIQTKSIYLKLPTKLTQKNDVQSLGLILFQLFIGHPFRLMISKSSKWEIKKELAEECKNIEINLKIQKLIQKMIDPIPLHRISIQQVQQFKWIKDSEEKQDFLNSSNSKINCQKITSLAALFIYYTIEKFMQNEKVFLIDKFYSIDINKEGKINFNDFVLLYGEITLNYRIKKTQKKLFEQIEDEQKCEISIQEFLILTIDQEKLLNDKIVQSSYMSLCNKNGYITPKSVAKKFQLDEIQLADMFSEFTEYDRLNLLEFKQILQEG